MIEKRILEHLKQGNSITQIEALNMFGCMRLASRIFDLRQRGLNIITDKLELSNGKTVAQYKLIH